MEIGAMATGHGIIFGDPDRRVFAPDHARRECAFKQIVIGDGMTACKRYGGG